MCEELYLKYIQPDTHDKNSEASSSNQVSSTGVNGVSGHPTTPDHKTLVLLLASSCQE